jgi:hypothetical protein
MTFQPFVRGKVNVFHVSASPLPWPRPLWGTDNPRTIQHLSRHQTIYEHMALLEAHKFSCG